MKKSAKRSSAKVGNVIRLGDGYQVTIEAIKGNRVTFRAESKEHIRILPSAEQNLSPQTKEPLS